MRIKQHEKFRADLVKMIDTKKEAEVVQPVQPVAAAEEVKEPEKVTETIDFLPRAQFLVLLLFFIYCLLFPHVVNSNLLLN